MNVTVIEIKDYQLKNILIKLERISKIKPFIDKRNWEGMNYT